MNEELRFKIVLLGEGKLFEKELLSEEFIKRYVDVE